MIKQLTGTLTLHDVHQINIRRRNVPTDGFDVIEISFRTRPTTSGHDEFTIKAFLRLSDKKLIIRKIGNDPDDLIERVIRVPGVAESVDPWDKIETLTAKKIQDEIKKFVEGETK